MNASEKIAKTDRLNSLKIQAYDIGKQVNDLTQAGLLMNKEITDLELELKSG